MNLFKSPATREKYSIPDFEPMDPCPVVIGNLLTYFDTGHMTATFSQALAGRLKKALNAMISTGI